MIRKILNEMVKRPFAVTLLCCLLFYFLPFKPKLFGDGEYHQGAMELIQFILNGFEGDVRVDKGLLTLFYYAIPYAVVFYFENDMLFYMSGIVFNWVVVSLAVSVLFKTLDLLETDIKAKQLVMLVLVLFPIHIYYAMGILAEAASFFLMTAVFYLWFRFIKERSNTRIIFLLIIALVSISSVRPNLIPFSILMLLVLVFYVKGLRLKALSVMVFVALAFTLVAFEKSINKESKDFKGMVFRNQLVWSRFELRDEPFNWLPQHGMDAFASSDYKNNLKKRRELDSISKVRGEDPNTVFVQWVANDIIENPFLTARQYFFKFFQSQSFVISPLMKSDKSTAIKIAVHAFINTINFILVFAAIGGLWFLVRNKKHEYYLPVLLMWSWSLLYVFIFHSEQRYMFPSRPALLILMAVFFTVMYQKREKTLFGKG